jgi:hypothetical protein
MGDAAHAGGRAGRVALDPAARSDPFHAPFRQHDAEVLLEVAAALDQGCAHIVFNRCPVIGMDALQETAKTDGFIRAVAEQGAAFLRHPDLVDGDVPLPQTELPGAGGELQALLALAQPLFAQAQPRAQPRSRNHIPAELVGHRDDHAEKEDGEHRRYADQTRVEQGCKDGCGQDAEECGPAHDGSTAVRVGIACPPEANGCVRYEPDEQQVAELRDDDVRVENADRRVDAFPAPERDRAHRRHLHEVHVDAGDEVQHQRHRAQAARSGRQPQPPGTEIEQDEANDGDEHDGDGHVGPAQNDGVIVWGGRPHQAQLEYAENGDRCGRHEEQQVAVLARLPNPYQQVDETEGEARRPDHRPRYVNPSHQSS